MNLIFLGTGDIALPSLRWLLEQRGKEHDHTVKAVVTQPDKPAGRGQQLKEPAPKVLARAHDLHVLQPPKLRSADAQAELAQFLPADCFVVMAYGQILPLSVLEMPRLTCLNLHASLLPAHRGAAPVHASVLAGDEESGITLMYMDEGMDTGDILLMDRLTLHPRETAGSLHDRLADLAPLTLKRGLELLEAGQAPRNAQDEKLATYAPKLNRAMGEIDWSLPAEALDRRIRGLHPWPGSFTFLPAEHDARGPLRLKILEAAPAPDHPDGTSPAGRVHPAGDERLIVPCGAGTALEILQVQPEGRKAMPAAEFLRGRQLPEPLILGQPCAD